MKDAVTKEGDSSVQPEVRFWYEKDKLKAKSFLIGVFTDKVPEEKAREHLEELQLLTETFQIAIVGSWCTSLRDVSSSTFLSKGKVDTLKTKAHEAGANVIIFDDEISPAQQRNLEKELGLPVLDRTEVILGVFAARAKTHEAKLQIELAQVKYMSPRLKRLWTHLSRQTGGGGGASGGGYLKGVGEKQIEVDRRILKQRMDKLQKELQSIRETRHMQKALRERNQIPVFAIVGYTNSGKSTLMNQLTHANVLVEDKLFATLDTTTRQLLLPNNQNILLTDTVGFIRKLPHLLVASFKSTLEEAVQADFLLHLIDASHPQAMEQSRTTIEVLNELNAKEKTIITVLNKTDLMFGPNGEEVQSSIQKLRIQYPGSIQISAKTGQGIEALKEAMILTIRSRYMRVQLKIPQAEYQIVSDVLEHATLFSKEYVENDVLLDVELPRSYAMKYLRNYCLEPLPPEEKEDWE
jgi:GTP-binding protein HflX